MLKFIRQTSSNSKLNSQCASSVKKTIIREHGVTGMPFQNLLTRTLSIKSNPTANALILGCGVAGCATALRLAERGFRVTMISAARDPIECNSYWAQGGIIYKSHDDAPHLLAHDIHRAGAGISFDPAVQKLAAEGPRCVEELLLKTSNVPFQRDDYGELALTLEASHNRPRIIYKADHTGRAITTSMLEAVKRSSGITLLTNMTAFEFGINGAGRCVGAYVVHNDSNETSFISADVTLLATGGLGDLYLNTSNPAGARGDGIAMAARAGAKLKNMEYVQFHPTTLYIPGERRFLLTEALRGEGAILRNSLGKAFAKQYHPLGELAPRDVVARMILAEMEREGTPHVYLDISHKSAEWLKKRFPTIYRHCIDRGIDLTKEPMPVVPAAHYHCGGVEVGLDGRTSIQGLYAAGEVSCTGLHGANRLASTSLLEGIVWGSAVADDILGGHRPNSDMTPENYYRSGSRIPDEEILEQTWTTLRRIMWEQVGPVRTKGGLESACTQIRHMWRNVDLASRTWTITPETVALRNAVMTSLHIAEAALGNSTSIGTHFIVDDNTVDISEDESVERCALSSM